MMITMKYSKIQWYASTLYQIINLINNHLFPTSVFAACTQGQESQAGIVTLHIKDVGDSVTSEARASPFLVSSS